MTKTPQFRSLKKAKICGLFVVFVVFLDQKKQKKHPAMPKAFFP